MTKDLWIEEADGLYTIGVTPAFQEEAGDVAYLDIASKGAINKDDSLFNVEASKAAIEVPSPMAGTILERNEAAIDDPSLINSEDKGQNWLVKLEAN